MTRFRSIFIVTMLFLSYTTYSYSHEDAKQQAMAAASLEETSDPEVDINLLSKAFGHMLGTQLTSLELEWNQTELIKGIADGLEGKEAPMSEKKCLAAISAEKNKIYQKKAKANLAAADTFMQKNAKKQGIIEVKKDEEKGVSLLQYQVKKPGKGPAVESSFSPLIHYRGTFIDGEVFSETKDGQRINLNEAIPGFKDGIVGMQENEERTIFIHPTLGYKTEGYLPPNSLLIFDVKLIKANAPADVETTSSATVSEKATTTKNEIASSPSATPSEAAH